MSFILYGNQWSGPTYKVALMLSLCGEAFNYRHIDLEARENRECWYMNKARFGQVPCLEDRETGATLVQSPVILEYLARKLKRFGAESEAQWIELREWFFWEFDRLAPYIYRPRGCAKGYLRAVPDVLTDLTKIGTRGLKVLDRHLDGREWMVGSAPTISDIDIFGIVSFAREGYFDLAEFPAVAAFMERVEALPGYASYHDLIPDVDRDAKELARLLQSRKHLAEANVTHFAQGPLLAH